MYCSVFFVRHGSIPALQGANVTAKMVLLDDTGSPASTAAATSMYTSDRWPGSYAMSASRDYIQANCVVDGYFLVLCSVDIVRDWRSPASSSMEEALPGLGHDLATMLDHQDLTDVTFDVDGESFAAHCNVLAEQSPVFREELYSPMAESNMAFITIQDMRASTFRTMLHYMYRGSLPGAEKADDSSTVAEYQHLVVAADRYGLERLKKICEEKLCGRSGIAVAVDIVVSMLKLVEEHACPKLKARCLDFLADGVNFKMVAITEEYIHLIQSFPSLLVEVRKRFKIAHEKPTIVRSTAPKKKRMC